MFLEKNKQNPECMATKNNKKHINEIGSEWST